MYSTGWF